MDRSRTVSYILGSKQHSTVQGWLDEGAVSAVVAFAGWQEQHGIHGDVAEIGVHHGKFFILLANLRSMGERAFAVDVFDDQHLNPDKSGRGDLHIFRDNIGKFGDINRVEIIQKDSLELTRADLYPNSEGSIRLFSIDGSHTAEHTCSDLWASSKILSQKGLIILDDFYNPDWPGVQEGFHRFLRDSSEEIAPIAYGNNKLFLCKKNCYEDYLTFVDNDLRPYLIHYKQVQIGNFRVAHIRLPDPELIFSRGLSLTQNVFSLRHPTFSVRATLASGWSTPNASGIWTVGPSADLRLRLIKVPDDEVRLVIGLQPFLHSQRVSRNLSVTVNSRDLGQFSFAKDTPGRLEIALPPGLLGTDCRIQFGIEEPERPSETLGTIDERPLGFLLHEVRIL
jgi:hypothetical protein